jgi:primase-polymerase (primpol)-like protein
MASSNQLAGIPTPLKSHANWVNWRLEEKFGKVPYVIGTNFTKRAKTDDPSTWRDFATAIQTTAVINGTEGIGFALGGKAENIIGLDIDGCRNPQTGEVALWAEQIIGELESYTEYTPSQTGVRVWITGKLPRDQKVFKFDPSIGFGEKVQVEVYDAGRYFTVTGDQYFESADIHRCDLNPVYTMLDELQKSHPRRSQPSTSNVCSTVSDSASSGVVRVNPVGSAITSKYELLMRGAPSGDKPFTLTDAAGNSVTYPDRSSADMAFCSLSAMEHGDDPDAIWTDYLNSAIVREKWTNREADFRKTIAKAIKSVIAPEEKTQIKEVLNRGLSSLETHEPRLVIRTAIKDLSKIQIYDESFPKPLTAKSLHGILGSFVDISLPTTSASQEMLLYQMLPILGSYLGKKYFVPFGADRHYTALNVLAIGKTADGKGQATHCVRNAMNAVDAFWEKRSIKQNPASGEALVRLAAGTGLTGSTTRIALQISEMKNLFDAMNREGSTLSGQLRNVYDCDPVENERSDKKKSFLALDYLIGILGTITPRELREVMGNINWANGVANRFLWCIATRSKTLKTSRVIPDFSDWAERVKALCALDREVNQEAFDYSKQGLELWDDWVDSLPEDDDDNLGLSQARVKPNCLRLASLYAQLDERRLQGWKIALEPIHVEAAIEIVTRSRESVAWYLEMGQSTKPTSTFADTDLMKLHVALAEKVRETGRAQISSTDVRNMFSRRSGAERDALCLAAKLHIEMRPGPSGGPPAKFWVA